MSSPTYFCGTVDVLYVKHPAESIEQDFCQGRYQLCGCYQHVHTVWSEDRTLTHECMFVVQEPELNLRSLS